MIHMMRITSIPIAMLTSIGMTMARNSTVILMFMNICTRTGTVSTAPRQFQMESKGKRWHVPVKKTRTGTATTAMTKCPISTGMRVLCLIASAVGSAADLERQTNS